MTMIPRGGAALLAAAALFAGGCCNCGHHGERDIPATMPGTRAAADAQWKSLFDGKTLMNWKASGFGAQADPYVKDGLLMLPAGDTLTGVTWTGDLIKQNYEISLEARRVDGSDFFCGLTFPVNDTCASLIVGGWGGGVVGISSLNNMDASENATTSYADFDNARWYRIRLRVSSNHLTAWIDDKKVVNADTTGQRISTRIDIDECRPLGLATYRTTAAFRDIKVRPLSDQEAAEANQ